MTSLFDYLDMLEPGDSDTVNDLRSLLDEKLPERRLQECEVIRAA